MSKYASTFALNLDTAGFPPDMLITMYLFSCNTTEHRKFYILCRHNLVNTLKSYKFSTYFNVLTPTYESSNLSLPPRFPKQNLPAFLTCPM
jgi:hypothetical protein